MHVPLSQAKAKLTELVRRAQAGEDVVLTRHGQPTVQIVPLKRPVDLERRRRALEQLRAMAQHTVPGPDAARSQDFLYDDTGMPG